ncbi:hypothetical protein P9112_012727 [Eukaryota sp. TZLM1-RC]
MQRRVIRLRKEYLFRKAVEDEAKEDMEKKSQIRKALAEGRRIPSELREEADSLKEQIIAEDARTMEGTSFLDDEYATATTRDPKILITTSRSPSTRLLQFAKELRLVFPFAERVNRGTTTVNELVDVSRRHDVTDLIILHETRGEPDGMVVSHMPHGPTAFFSISNAVLRHDVPDVQPMSEAIPHLIFDGLNSKLGSRITKILKHLFPVPKVDSKRVITFANRNDFIVFRHHTFDDKGKEVELAEAGPRFVLRPYKILLGSLEMEEAEVEFTLRPYMNSSRKRQFLA